MEPTRETWGNVQFLWESGENDGLCIMDWLKPDQDLMDEVPMAYVIGTCNADGSSHAHVIGVPYDGSIVRPVPS